MTVHIPAITVQLGGAPGLAIVHLDTGVVQGVVVEEGEDTALVLGWSQVISATPTVTFIVSWLRDSCWGGD